jgi:hypothetical protein
MTVSESLGPSTVHILKKMSQMAFKEKRELIFNGFILSNVLGT